MVLLAVTGLVCCVAKSVGAKPISNRIVNGAQFSVVRLSENIGIPNMRYQVQQQRVGLNSVKIGLAEWCGRICRDSVLLIREIYGRSWRVVRQWLGNLSQRRSAFSKASEYLSVERWSLTRIGYCQENLYVLTCLKSLHDDHFRAYPSTLLDDHSLSLMFGAISGRPSGYLGGFKGSYGGFGCATTSIL